MKKIADMTEGAMLKNIILFAIPVILTNILNGLYNTADIIIIGKFAGSDALAAVGNCTSVINVSFCLFLGLALGGGVLVSHGVGAGDDEGVSKTVHTSAVMSILLGIILMVIGILITPFMLKLISTPSNIFEQSKLYLQIFFAGSIPNLLYSFLAAILRALGNSKKPLYYLMISCFVKIFLNTIFVAVLKLDILGVGIATVVAQLVSASLAIYEFMRTKERHRIDIKKLGINRSVAGRILKLGLPIGITSAMFDMANLILSSYVNSFDNVYIIAGSTVEVQLDQYLPFFVNGMVSGILTFAGQNMGAKKYDRIIKGANKATVFCGGLVFTLSVCLIIFAKPLMSLFNDDPNVIEWARRKQMLSISLYLLFAIYECLSAAIKGCGNTRLPMIISVLSICVSRILWLKIMVPVFNTIETVYMAYPVSYVLAAGATYVVYKFCRRLWLCEERVL